MAAGYSQECQQTDTLPLLMDHASTVHSSEHVLNIANETEEVFCSGNQSTTLPHSSSHSETIISLNPPRFTTTDESSSGSVSTRSTSPPAPEMHHSSAGFESRQRTSPLNSGLWISIELTITLSQIIASIIVLSLSRDEKPKAPLSVWVLGYAAGCLATLPLLYWRYSHHYPRQMEQTAHHPTSAVASSNDWNVSQSSFSSNHETFSLGRESNRLLFLARTQRSFIGGDQRMDIHIERFKIALDCFFAVWFIVGNVWIFGGHSSSREAPNLYRLCIVFLTFSCIGYAMPFIICATICCCLPCLITVLGFREDQEQTKGAAPEIIEALPVYKFKQKRSRITGKECKDPNDSDGESFDEGGIVGPGTSQEQLLSAEDAVCCICLGKYKDGVDLRGLPCTHFFHVHCVDKWLKINSVCPLCKHDINVLDDESEQPM